MKADVTIKRGELVERSLLAFDLLCYEDHYALPCKDMQDVIDESIQLIKHREIIYVKEEIQSEHFQERWARNMARNIEREMFDEDENERFEGHFDIQVFSAPHFSNSIFFLYSEQIFFRLKAQILVVVIWTEMKRQYIMFFS